MMIKGHFSYFIQLTGIFRYPSIPLNSTLKRGQLKLSSGQLYSRRVNIW